MEQRNVLGETALLLAAQNNRPTVFKELVAKGARVDVANGKGKTVLEAAVTAKCSECVKLILAKGTQQLNQSIAHG